MAYRIILSNHFKKDAKNLSKKQIDKTKAVIQMIADGEVLPVKYSDHQLKGELKEEQIIIEGEQEELHSKINDDLNKNAIKANDVMEKANDKVKEKNLDDSSDDLSELYDELTK